MQLILTGLVLLSCYANNRCPFLLNAALCILSGGRPSDYSFHTIRDSGVDCSLSLEHYKLQGLLYALAD